MEEFLALVELVCKKGAYKIKSIEGFFIKLSTFIEGLGEITLIKYAF